MIDTHQHLISPDRFTYAWAADVPQLQGAFTLDTYQELACDAGIEGSLFMEVDVAPAESAGEARFFCELAMDPVNRILGVIAGARPEAEAGFEEHLDAITHPKLKGIRRVLHTQPDTLSTTAHFRANLRILGQRGLPFDLCMRQDQHARALDLIRACPGTQFILDHCGVPEVAANDAPAGEGFQAWRQSILRLGGESNLCGKLSGLTTYAADSQRNAKALQPYIDTMLEAFGPTRLVWGGDWPVVNLGSGLPRWCELTRELIAPLTPEEQQMILSANARRIYALHT